MALFPLLQMRRRQSFLSKEKRVRFNRCDCLTWEQIKRKEQILHFTSSSAITQVWTTHKWRQPLSSVFPLYNGDNHISLGGLRGYRYVGEMHSSVPGHKQHELDRSGTEPRPLKRWEHWILPTRPSHQGWLQSLLFNHISVWPPAEQFGHICKYFHKI